MTHKGTEDGWGSGFQRDGIGKMVGGRFPERWNRKDLDMGWDSRKIPERKRTAVGRVSGGMELERWAGFPERWNRKDLAGGKKTEQR